MKKIRSLFLVVVAVLFLSGCYEHKVDMVINDDKSMKLSVDIKIDMSMLDGFGDGNNNPDESEPTVSGNDYEAVDEEQIAKLKERGYDVIVNQEGNKSSVSVSKTFSNIDDISVEEDIKIVLSDLFKEDFNDSKFFTVTKKLTGNVYKANFIFQNNESDESMGDLSMYENMFDLSYKVTLPGKSVSNNATTVSEDGKVLTWDLSISGPNQINYEFQFANNIMLFLIIGGVLLAVIGVVVFIFIRKNKKNQSSNNEPIVPEQLMQQPQQTIIQEQSIQQPQQTIIQEQSIQQPQQAIVPEQLMQQPQQTVVPEQPVQQPLSVEDLLKPNSDKSV